MYKAVNKYIHILKFFLFVFAQVSKYLAVS